MLVRLHFGLICGALVIATYFGYNALGSDLLPAMDEGAFILDYLTPAGTSLAETNRILTHVEQILHNTPEVTSPLAAPGCNSAWQP